MSTLAELHERWSRDPDYREAYEQLGRNMRWPER